MAGCSQWKPPRDDLLSGTLLTFISLDSIKKMPA
jgi:hypothetical protein